jgi:hypothetical protein
LQAGKLRKLPFASWQGPVGRRSKGIIIVKRPLASWQAEQGYYHSEKAARRFTSWRGRPLASWQAEQGYYYREKAARPPVSQLAAARVPTNQRAYPLASWRDPVFQNDQVPKILRFCSNWALIY